MSEHAQITLLIWGFWLMVIALDAFALVRLRRLRLPAVAVVLWTMWIIVVPIVGAVTFFIVGREQTAA